MFSLDPVRVFGHVIRDYTREVFQETYDADLLRNKLEALRRAQARIKTKRLEDMRQITRLERMGEYYDKTMGPIGASTPKLSKKIPKPPASR